MTRPPIKKPLTRREVRNALRLYASAAPNPTRASAGIASFALDVPEKQRAKPRYLEGAEQRAFIKWCRLASGAHPELAEIYHVPNGGARDRITGAKLKAEGVVAGVPDLQLDVARGGYHGWRCELKAAGGRVSVEQNERLRMLSARGYNAIVCYGWESARDAVLEYLALPA